MFKVSDVQHNLSKYWGQVGSKLLTTVQIFLGFSSVNPHWIHKILERF